MIGMERYNKLNTAGSGQLEPPRLVLTVGEIQIYRHAHGIMGMKEVPRLDLTSSTTPGQQIHKFDHTRTANPCD